MKIKYIRPFDVSRLEMNKVLIIFNSINDYESKQQLSFIQ